MVSMLWLAELVVLYELLDFGYVVGVQICLIKRQQFIREIDGDRKDDLESVKEQINAPAPKKKRLQKAVDGIKKFFGDFSPQLAAALAAHAITTADWNAMITAIEGMISSL